jgi:hypothetical protein
LLLPKAEGISLIVTHFPSDVYSLPLLLELFSSPSRDTAYHLAISSPESWELRSVLLLWLSLLMTVPFGLSAFDKISSGATSVNFSQTAVRVEILCRPLLYKPSKEGEYAALTLAKLYARPDCMAGLNPCLEWVRGELDKKDDQHDGLEAIFVSSIPLERKTRLAC